MSGKASRVTPLFAVVLASALVGAGPNRLAPGEPGASSNAVSARASKTPTGSKAAGPTALAINADAIAVIAISRASQTPSHALRPRSCKRRIISARTFASVSPATALSTAAMPSPWILSDRQAHAMTTDTPITIASRSRAVRPSIAKNPSMDWLDFGMARMASERRAQPDATMRLEAISWSAQRSCVHRATASRL